MSRGLSATAIAELNAATCAEPYLVLLTIAHADITTLRFVNDRANVTSGGDLYTGLSFSAKLPADRDGPVSAQITLDNVDRATITAVRSITTPTQSVSGRMNFSNSTRTLKTGNAPKISAAISWARVSISCRSPLPAKART